MITQAGLGLEGSGSRLSPTVALSSSGELGSGGDNWGAGGKGRRGPVSPAPPTPAVCSGLGSCSGFGSGWLLPLGPWLVCLPALFACPLASPLTQLVLDSDFLLSSLRKSTVVLVVKNPPASAGDIRDTGSIPGLGRSPGDVIGNPLQYSCLENPHGQRSLVGYSPWGHNELDMQVSMHLPAYVCRGF